MGYKFVFSRTNSTKSPASGEGNVEPRPTCQAEKVREIVCALNPCVPATGAVKVAVFVCLRSSCNHVSEVRRPLKFERLALKVVTQNHGDIEDVILLLMGITLCLTDMTFGRAGASDVAGQTTRSVYIHCVTLSE